MVGKYSSPLLDAGMSHTGGMLANRRGSSTGDLGVSTGGLGDVTGAEGVFSYVQEPEETAKYKSNLPKLYGNELLSVVQKGIIALFQGKSPEESLISLNSKVKSLIKLDIGEFVVPFYEERILKKGMWIIREDIKEDEGENLLVGLTDIWNNFYRELLPALQVIFCGVPEYKNLSIEERTLIAFRDEMLLKTNIRGSIILISRSKHRQLWERSNYSNNNNILDDRITAAIQQMFLVTLSASTPCHKQYYELETLAAQVISPLMTARGVYYDGKVTPVASGSQQYLNKSQSSGNLKRLEMSANSLTLPRKVAAKHTRQRSQPAVFLREIFSVGSSYTTESKLTSSSRGRTQSQSDIL